MTESPTSDGWQDRKVFKIVGNDASFFPKSVVELRDLVKEGRFDDGQLVELIGIPSAAKPVRIPIDLARLGAPFSYIERQFALASRTVEVQSSRILTPDEDRELREELSAALDDEMLESEAVENELERAISSHIDELRTEISAYFGTGPLATLEMMAFVPSNLMSSGAVASLELFMSPRDAARFFLYWLANVYLRGTSPWRAIFVPKTARLRKRAKAILTALGPEMPLMFDGIGARLIARTKEINSSLD